MVRYLMSIMTSLLLVLLLLIVVVSAEERYTTGAIGSDLNASCVAVPKANIAKKISANATLILAHALQFPRSVL